MRALRRRWAAHVGRESSVLFLGFQLQHQISADGPNFAEASNLKAMVPFARHTNGVKRAANCGRDPPVERLLVAAPVPPQKKPQPQGEPLLRPPVALPNPLPKSPMHVTISRFMF